MAEQIETLLKNIDRVPPNRQDPGTGVYQGL